MKRVIFVRHGKAEIESSKYEDIDRRLTNVGIKHTKIIASVLSKKDITIDLIVSSTAVRAYETAKIFAEKLSYPEQKIIKEEFIYEGYTTGQLIDYINQQDNKYNSIMIVGHNPCISQSSIRISKNFHYKFNTSSCVSLLFETNKWDIQPITGEIEFFEFPRKYH